MALPFAALLVWWLAARLAFLPEYVLPSPASVLSALGAYVFGSNSQNAYGGRFLGDFVSSMTRIGCGFFLAVLAGLPLGLASGRISALRWLLTLPVGGLRAVPGICWLPLALVWLGIGFKTTVFLIAIAAFFPIYLNSASGASSVPAVLVRAGSMLGLSRIAVSFRIILPASMPHIRTGLRLGLGLSFAYLVLGELTGVPDGIGAMIMDARLLGRVDMIMAGIILMAVLGWVADRLLVLTLRTAFKSARRS
ncbi:ABC transporter permease [Fundidesulfovibrio putealis]|uniref:ABC transporter permease n=1 Tax=Fundidesulfovibrio putealis TaxID=270496 RepID=UPI001F2EBD5A|nr:ABC transporter permease [Fundidesulfovibrio putealis]